MTDARPQAHGSHYQLPIQPIDFIMQNDLGFAEGCVIKYVARYQRKGTPIQDLEKAKQYLDFLIERERERQQGANRTRTNLSEQLRAFSKWVTTTYG